MINNVYLFTGDERILLDQEVKKRSKAFSQKKGENSVFIFDEENFDNNQAIQIIFGSGFFSSETLTIIKGLPPSGNAKSSKYEVFTEEFIKRKGKIPEGSFLVFAVAQPDKRTKLYKFLKTHANIKIFNKLKKSELKIFIRNNLDPTTIEDDALEIFIEKTGDELSIIINELDKLNHRIQVTSPNIITKKNIEEITYNYSKQDAFKFFSILFKNEEHRILQFVEKIKNDNSNRNMFLGSLYRTLNIYLNLLNFFDQGIEDENIIRKKYKINPFILKINLGQKNILKKHNTAIKEMFIQLVELDKTIKFGKKSAESFRLELKKIIYLFYKKNNE